MAKASSNGATITKVDAMQEALQQLGKDAKNRDLEEYIRSKHGEGAVPSNFTVTKSAVMKKLRQGRRAGRKPAGQATPSSPALKSIRLEDLREIKGLAGRYGKDQVKGLLDLLA